MAQASRRLKRARRTKRNLTLAHRQYDRLVREARPVLQRGQMEGQLLRIILLRHGAVGVFKAELGQFHTGDIDISAIPDTEMVEIRYVPTPLEQSRVEAETGSDPTVVDDPALSYAEPEAAV